MQVLAWNARYGLLTGDTALLEHEVEGTLAASDDDVRSVAVVDASGRVLAGRQRGAHGSGVPLVAGGNPPAGSQSVVVLTEALVADGAVRGKALVLMTTTNARLSGLRVAAFMLAASGCLAVLFGLVAWRLTQAR